MIGECSPKIDIVAKKYILIREHFLWIWYFCFMGLRFHMMMLTILGMMGCHSASHNEERGAAARYDSTNITPANQDSANTHGAAARNAEEEQILAQDSVFEDGSRPTTWANAGFDDPVRFKRFLVKYKEWARRDQVDSIAAHIRFPIRGAGSAAWFKEQYPHIFNRHLKAVIFRQRLDRIFRNGQGAMIGNGDIWFVEERGRYLATAVN